MEDARVKIKIISATDGLKLAQDFPGLGYGEDFFRFTKDFSGGFLAVYVGNELALLFPVNFSGKKIYALYKDYVEPIFFKNINCDTWQEIIKILKKDFDYIEFYFGLITQSRQLDGFRNAGLSIYVLDLFNFPAEEDIFQKFNKKTRNEIRKSLKAGFDFKIGTPEDLAAVYDLYAQNMKRHGTPVRPKEFFQKFFDVYGKNCKIFLAYDKEILAGVNFALINKNYLRLAFNFSRTEYWPQCVNNFLYFKMIEWGRGEGVKYFDFGPSLNSDKSHVHFKLGFGGRTVPLFKLLSGKASYKFKNWFLQKKHNFKIRWNKLKKVYE